MVGYRIVHSKKIGVPASSKLAHDIWCAVHTLYMVCIAHLIWCVMHTIFGVENTLCIVCYYIAFCPGLAFTHVNMYNIDTIQLQSSHEQYSKCVVLLSNVFVRYFVADIQSNCHAALVSRGQTTIFAQGRYRFQYKRPARIGSGTVHSSHWYNYHRCGDGCKLITRFGDASF